MRERVHLTTLPEGGLYRVEPDRPVLEILTHGPEKSYVRALGAEDPVGSSVNTRAPRSHRSVHVIAVYAVTVTLTLDHDPAAGSGELILSALDVARERDLINTQELSLDRVQPAGERQRHRHLHVPGRRARPRTRRAAAARRIELRGRARRPQRP